MVQHRSVTRPDAGSRLGAGLAGMIREIVVSNFKGNVVLKKTMGGLRRATVFRGSSKLDAELLRQETLPQPELERLTAERSIAHARFAMEHSPFYRDRYTAAGFSLKDLHDPAAFLELPVIEKAEVREHWREIRSSEATSRNSKISTTGGSTGQPLRLLRDLRFPARALEWRLMRWWGVRPDDDVAVVYRHVRSRKESMAHAALWWPSRKYQLDAYTMTPESIDRFVAQWTKHPPELLIGYVGGIAELASILRGRTPLPTPTAVAVTAAPVTPAQRNLISSVFGAPVYDHYRSAEIPWIGGECREQNGLHTFGDVRRIEVLGTDGRQVEPGVIGQVVATDLTNRVFPLVRYRLGDRTTTLSGACACGVTLPRIASVQGRVSDALRMPDGQVIAGEGLTQICSRYPDAVRQFQIVQHEDFSITVKFVLGEEADAPSRLPLIIGHLTDIVRGKVPVVPEIVDEIPHDGGKVRYIRSELAKR